MSSVLKKVAQAGKASDRTDIESNKNLKEGVCRGQVREGADEPRMRCNKRGSQMSFIDTSAVELSKRNPLQIEVDHHALHQHWPKEEDLELFKDTFELAMRIGPTCLGSRTKTLWKFAS